MNYQTYERDLDLNLLRVFVVVADEGSVTRAAARLYLTQPAVSAALARLRRAVGRPIFLRQGRSLVLTAHGQKMLDVVRPHLRALVDAATQTAAFDPATHDRTFRLGLSDDGELWLLPPLLRALAARAPNVRVVVIPVQFRTVNAALLEGRVDLAVTVADEAPPSVMREALGHGSFVCLFDPRHAKLGARPSQERYLAHAHVIVSYNGDTRGLIEDALGVQRKVACAVPRFGNIGGLIEGTPLVATVPKAVATRLVALFPVLKTAPLPFELPSTPLEVLWLRAADDDDGLRYLRAQIKDAHRKGTARPA